MSWPYDLPVPWRVAGLELKEAPGEWRHAASYFNRQSARVTASAVRRGQIPGLARLGQFDAEHRVVDGEYRVYVRYVGPGSTSPEPGPVSVSPAIPASIAPEDQLAVWPASPEPGPPAEGGA